MLYFKNVDLAETYRISEGTVRNWIKAAKEGKLDLVLHDVNGKPHVANTSSNIATIEKLIEGNRKYRNTKAVKVITPRPEFYKLYNQAQIYDIATDLEVHHEIARQYNYFDGGAIRWDAYVQRRAKEDVLNTTTGTMHLLERNNSYIDSLLSRYKRVNIVDIGPGNVVPIRSFLENLLDKKILGRYIGLDISPTMLGIAKSNIKEWFGGKVQFEGYELDINYDRFANILAEEYLRKDADTTINLVLFVGGTLGNLRNPGGALRIIHDSLVSKDLLIHAQKLDTERTRRNFDFDIQPGEPDLAPIHGLMVELLNIDKAFYDVEMGFDQQKIERFSRIRLKLALTFKFKFDVGERFVELHKGDTILVWRAKQQTALEVANQFDRNDFHVLHSSQTDDQSHILTISKVKSEN